MASKEVVQGQASIDQNVMELKKLLERAAQLSPVHTQRVLDFLYDADDQNLAASDLDRMPCKDRLFFLSLIIPFACLGHQMISVSKLAEMDEEQAGG